VIAAASGLTLTKIKRIQEAGAQVISPASGMRAFQEAKSETPISPGKIEIHGNLTVIYECRPKK
jgi:uncharacterized protein YggE